MTMKRKVILGVWLVLAIINLLLLFLVYAK